VRRGRAGGYQDGYGEEPYDDGYRSPDDDATIDVRSLGYDERDERDEREGHPGYDAGYDESGEYEDYGEYEQYSEEYEEPDAYPEDESEADGVDEDAALPVSNRIFTIPNLISLARLAGVPLFLGLILSPYYGGPKYDVQALVILALSGFSDWLDGKLARRWNQMSKFGALIDPLADRLYILATLVGLTIRHIIPLWLPIVLVGRDVAMLVLITPKLRKAGYGVALPVHFLGKAATFNLLYAFPLLLLGQIGEKHSHLTDIGNIFGWAFVGWGTALYLLAGGMYFVQARQVTRTAGR
jgi:cardiolipin synthase